MLLYVWGTGSMYMEGSKYGRYEILESLELDVFVMKGTDGVLDPFASESFPDFNPNRSVC
jgi:hypothetical protein